MANEREVCPEELVQNPLTADVYLLTVRDLLFWERPKYVRQAQLQTRRLKEK